MFKLFLQAVLFNTLIIQPCLLLIDYWPFSHNINEQFKVLKDNKQKQPNLSKIIMEGIWKSSQQKPMDFFGLWEGIVISQQVYILQEQQLFLVFLFLDGSLIEDKIISVFFKVPSKTTDYGINYQNTTQKFSQAFDVFNFNETKNCNTELELKYLDENNAPVQIEYPDMNQLHLKGTIKSNECNLEIAFEIKPSYINIDKILIFLVIYIALNYLVLLQIIKESFGIQGLNKLLIFSKYFWLGNLLTEICIMNYNFNFSMAVYYKYTEFFMVVFFIQSILIMIKFKILFEIHEQEIQITTQDQQEQKKLRNQFMFKCMGTILLIILIENLYQQTYWIYLILFTYPLIQIYQNINCVVQKNCYSLKYHLVFVMAQLAYPLAIRFSFFDFFRLKSDNVFIISLLAVSFLLQTYMLLQKSFGRHFGLPSFMLPNYHNYYKAINRLENQQENCPICYNQITDEIDLKKDLLQEKLISSKFMQTPCKHNFHISCLRTWMDSKLVCPTCRQRIPPY